MTWQFEEVSLNNLVDAGHLCLDEAILGHIADKLHHQMAVDKKATIQTHLGLDCRP